MSSIEVESQGAVQVWTIQNVARRNALSLAVVKALATCVSAVSAQRAVRVVVLRGAGDQAFCAGADLKERASMSVEQVHEFLGLLRDTFCAIEASECVFIAYLNGSAFGGGLELALSCDLRVAETSAQMALTEVTLGIIPGAGGTQRLPRVVGQSAAKELILSGRKVSSEEALRLGLLSRVGPLEIAVDLAQQIARNAPLALGAAKHAIDRGFGLPLSEGLTLEQEMYARTLGSSDRREGLRAFAEKRQPVFKGE